MACFLNAMDKRLGENGRLELTTSGNVAVDVFNGLLRGASVEKVRGFSKALEKEMEEATTTMKEQALTDAFVLFFLTRDPRNGKGERSASMLWFVELAKLFPLTTMEVLPMIPKFGRWLDVVEYSECDQLPEAMRRALRNLHVEAIRCGEDPLAGKWAPRITGSKVHVATAKAYARQLFPGDPRADAKYRKATVALTAKHGEVTETLMCAQEGRWKEIDPGKVPAGCLNKHAKALLNEATKKQQQKAKEEGVPVEVVRSEKEDRVQCAENFKEHAEQACAGNKDKKMHGKTLSIDKMVAEHLAREPPSSGRSRIIEAQYMNLKEGLLQSLELAASSSSSLGNMVAMVDVSGSMTGTPMEAAIGLGTLVSEVTAPAFRGRVLTFSEEPKWHCFKEDMSFKDKVRSARGADWGMTTDFTKALKLVLRACVDGDVPPSEVASLKLVVFSDMQFDAAMKNNAQSSSPYYMNAYNRKSREPVVKAWETQHEELVRMFKEAGECSKFYEPYPVPRIIYWNLRGDTPTHAMVKADTPGVDLVSGFSALQLKLFLDGEDVADDKQSTPEETTRKALDAPEYEEVRAACARVAEWRGLR